MPINLPSDHPKYNELKNGGVSVMDKDTALRQDIRPLEIALLNLMPFKIQTEMQFTRLLGAGPLQVEINFIRMTTHQPKHESWKHLERFYQTFEEVKARKFDGIIITGAPIECLDYEAVDYWEELTEVMRWTQTHVHSTLGVCWGAMAMLYHFHRVPKYILDKKISGCFRQNNLAPASPYLRGFSDDCVVPVSRWTEISARDLEDRILSILMGSETTGPGLNEDKEHRALYSLNHFEYDRDTLSKEYRRDQEKGVPNLQLPVNYFPKDNPKAMPINRWRSHGHLLYCNWINELYQTTPYHLKDIGT